MGYLSERISYIKGLADGLDLGDESKEAKVLYIEVNFNMFVFNVPRASDGNASISFIPKLFSRETKFSLPNSSSVFNA